MKKIFCVFAMFALYGCSVFMPYHEDFACNVPEGQGYCGSLTDIYDYTVRMERGGMYK